jgi:hypothetical protein
MPPSSCLSGGSVALSHSSSRLWMHTSGQSGWQSTPSAKMHMGDSEPTPAPANRARGSTGWGLYAGPLYAEHAEHVAQNDVPQRNDVPREARAGIRRVGGGPIRTSSVAAGALHSAGWADPTANDPHEGDVSVRTHQRLLPHMCRGLRLAPGGGQCHRAKKMAHSDTREVRGSSESRRRPISNPYSTDPTTERPHAELTRYPADPLV